MGRRRNRTEGPELISASPKGVGGTWSPIPASDIELLASAAFDILTKTGVSEAPPVFRETIAAQGGKFSADRLLFPAELLHATITSGPKNVLLAGQRPEHDLDVGGQNVYAGTGGAAPNILDADADGFRPSILTDLHRAARLADALKHVRFFSRSLVAGDIEDPLEFDLATAAASLAGTSKHVMVQASDPAHVADLAGLCHEIAGSEAKFRERPFLSLNINHAVPPLRIHAESAEVMAEAVAFGIPVHCNVFGQLGASSPVTLAGSVAQTLAETLAGLAFVHALDPKAPRIAGPRSMITDLRTGGMAGGAGEQAMATTLAVQVLRHWGLPCSVIAGATDSKSVDFQSGYEKAMTVGAAIQSGANLITQAAGTQGGLMAASFEAMVADNEMIGALMRANSSPEVSEETLMLKAIEEVVTGEGHFLGHPETYARMRTDFLYPQVADRASIEEWNAPDRTNMRQRAALHATELLSRHWPDHLSEKLRESLPNRFGLETKDEVQP